ncbi:MAG: hypothetical protein HQK67_00240 [Desulfamplus sp.]|nr:hypothetical protein [Desulfamplus sp.]
MEIRTTLKDFSDNIKYFHFPPETYLRIIIDTEMKEKKSGGRKELLPSITREQQRHFLNLIPNEYHSDASEELVKIIEHSHTNTDMLNLK